MQSTARLTSRCRPVDKHACTRNSQSIEGWPNFGLQIQWHDRVQQCINQYSILQGTQAWIDCRLRIRESVGRTWLWHLNANNTNVLLWILNRHSDRHAPWIAKERHLRSKIRWFTEFCNSHYLSHLAAFFIDPRAKRSTVRSCLYFFSNSHAGEWYSNSGKHDIRSLRKNTKSVHVGPRSWQHCLTGAIPSKTCQLPI